MVGDVTYKSAAYVARYIVKKIKGARASWYYDDIDPETGEILRELTPEYANMSRRPGIGKTWYEKFKKDVFPDDFLVVAGKKITVPKYYLTQLELASPELYGKIRGKRLNAKDKNKEENTTSRLLVREECTLAKLSQLSRSYENGI